MITQLAPTKAAAPPKTMKAFAMLGLGRTGFVIKPLPVAGPNDAIVKTTHALICTSDSHTVRGAIGPRELLTLGHEAVGIVYEVGSEVRRFRPGDRVVVGAITPDWGSEEAQNGFASQSSGPLGGWKYANIKDGVFAEYFHVNEADANMALIPSDVASEQAVYCADMLSTGFMAAEHGEIPIGGTVAVFAQGPVGLMATAGARLRGAGQIFAVESDPRRADLAREFGAHLVVDFSKEDPVVRNSRRDRRCWRRHGYRGARRGEKLSAVRRGDKARRNDLKCRLSRFRRLCSDSPRSLGCRNGRQDDPNRALSRRKPPHGTTSESSPATEAGSDENDDAHVQLRRYGQSVRDHGSKARRRAQAVDRLLDGVARPSLIKYSKMKGNPSGRV